MPSELLRNTDLNLLVAFSVLLRERSVSRAAARLYLGQSGMSGALARLRALLGDPLLVQVGRRLEPTPRALELVDEIDAALGLIERALAPARAFSVAATERVFRLGVTDDHELLFGAALASALVREAPHARLVLRSTHRYSLRAALDDGEVDAATSAIKELPAWHLAEPLFTQGHACLWSPRQLGGVRRTRGAGLSLDEFVAHPHALVTFRGDLTSAIDEQLAALGRARRVVIGVSRFSALPELLTSAPLIATVPQPIAARFARDHGLAFCPPPLALPPLAVALVFRKRDAAERELLWFRELVCRTVRQAMAESGSAPARNPPRPTKVARAKRGPKAGL